MESGLFCGFRRDETVLPRCQPGCVDFRSHVGLLLVYLLALAIFCDCMCTILPQEHGGAAIRQSQDRYLWPHTERQWRHDPFSLASVWHDTVDASDEVCPRALLI